MYVCMYVCIDVCMHGYEIDIYSLIIPEHSNEVDELTKAAVLRVRHRIYGVPILMPGM
jgi:hypothetical protein